MPASGRESLLHKEGYWPSTSMPSEVKGWTPSKVTSIMLSLKLVYVDAHSVVCVCVCVCVGRDNVVELVFSCYLYMSSRGGRLVIRPCQGKLHSLAESLPQPGSEPLNIPCGFRA